ncbi:MAG: DUF5615 family PIN-like protein [bacterium]|nr:DUF5615 family PIN-like protein [bacterium]
MNVKLDENVPAGLVSVLRGHGHGATTVSDEGLAGQPDATIWDAAQRENRLLVTMDRRFADVRSLGSVAHAGIIVLRPSTQGRRAIRALFESLVDQHPLEPFMGAIVIVDDRRIRVRRP